MRKRAYRKRQLRILRREARGERGIRAPAKSFGHLSRNTGPGSLSLFFFPFFQGLLTKRSYLIIHILYFLFNSAMHLQATAILSHRYHKNEEIQNLLRRMNADTLIGTSSYSDSATGKVYLLLS